MPGKIDEVSDLPVAKEKSSDPHTEEALKAKTQHKESIEDPEKAHQEKDNVSKIIEKARREEKEKLYPEIERLKALRAETEEKLSGLMKNIEEKTREIEDLRSGKIQEMSSVNRELRELREKNQKLEAAIESVATEAASKIRKSELSAYKEKRISAAGISQFADFVNGDSEEAIDETIKKIKDRQESLLKQAREEARVKLAESLPTPISPNGAHGRGPAPAINPKQKYDIASLKGVDYQKYRDQLLLDAKQKAGLV